MSFSRIYDEPDRIALRNQQSTGPGRYMLDVPGNGIKPPFIEDPQIILQKWGANLRTHPVDLEAYLLGYDETLNRHCKVHKMPATSLPDYPVNNTMYTDESRSMLPAWELRDGNKKIENYLLFNPQKNVEIPFQNNYSTRIQEKDKQIYKIKCI